MLAHCIMLVYSMYLTVSSSGFPEQRQKFGICNGFALRSLWVLKFCVRILLRMTLRVKISCFKDVGYAIEAA